jgi:hypothetical protein
MTAITEIARCPQFVKDALVNEFRSRVDALFADPVRVGRSLESAVWDVVVPSGRALQAALLAQACWHATVDAARDDEPLRLRLDEDYWLTQMTTFGPVTVPLFAFRNADGRTQAPYGPSPWSSITPRDDLRRRLGKRSFHCTRRVARRSCAWSGRPGLADSSRFGRRRTRWCSSRMVPPPSRTPRSLATS